MTTVMPKAAALSDAEARTNNPDLAEMADRADAQSLTAQARAAFPRIVLEQRELPQGSYVIHRDATDHGVHYIVWDPAQITREKIEIYINIYIAGSEQYVEYSRAAYDALRGFQKFRKAADTPAAVEFWDIIEQVVIAADDPAAAVDCISRTLTREYARSTA